MPVATSPSKTLLSIVFALTLLSSIVALTLLLTLLTATAASKTPRFCSEAVKPTETALPT